MTEKKSFFKRFWEDLKRRHVVRVAVGYTIGAWAIVQIAEILLPTIDAGDWLFRAIVAVAFLGFPVTLILAWVFDISDNQVVVTDTKGFRFPKWVKSLLALPLIALVGVAGWWVWSGYVTEKESSVRPTDLTDKVPIVAVMPFRNVTGNPDMDWYSEGLANLVRDNLTRSRYLRVVSPMKWKTIVGDASSETEMAERAADEGVGFILGGEMLITPGGITVASRLTDTKGGVSLSSRQVDNLSAENLLTASGPIATQVKQGLNVPREEQVDVYAADFATNNLSAYEAYIAGLGFFLHFKYEQAAQAFNAALQLAPDFAIARYRLAYIQLVSGNTELAASNIDQALKSPYLAGREKMYIEAAQALFSWDFDTAVQKYEAILKEYPFELEARQLLAESYWGQYRTDDAIRELERLASEEPQNEVIWSTLGSYLLQMGEIDRAQPALKRFASLAPNNANSYTLLADSLRFQGKFDEAVAEYDKALKIDPNMHQVATSLATISYLKRDYDAAAGLFTEITNNAGLLPRERLDALFPLVSLHAARGNFALASELIEQFDQALKEEQIRQAMATSMLALYQVEMGRNAPALELAGSAIRQAPGVPTRYLFARGQVELKSGEYGKAIQTAQEIKSHALPESDSDRTEEKAAAFLTGMAYLHQDKATQAEAELKQALELEGFAYAVYELGMARLMMSTGRTQEALELIAGSVEPDLVDARIDLEPERVQALLLKAEINRAGGKLAEAGRNARDFLQRFDQADANHPAAALAHRIAEAARVADLGTIKKGGTVAALVYP